MKLSKKKKLAAAVAAICFTIAIVMLIMMAKSSYDEKRNAKEIESLQEMINSTTQETTTETETTTEAETTAEPDTESKGILEMMGIDVPKKNINWEILHRASEDIYAWIYIPGTDVDYPVLQHPDNNEYYLRYNMDGSYGKPGCLYTETYNKKDFSDKNTVIYGHTIIYETDVPTMFTTLHKFEDEELFSQDNYIYVYTEDYIYVYQIFAVYEYPAIHLLLNFDYENHYGDYLRSMKDSAGDIKLFRDDIEVTEEDQIITLSTCPLDLDFTYRHLTAGVLLNPKQE